MSDSHSESDNNSESESENQIESNEYGMPQTRQPVPPGRQPDIQEQLNDILSSLERRTNFAATGTFETNPLLQVDSVGVLGLPLCSEQADKLMQVMKLAPYGRGSETAYDDTVRYGGGI